MKLTIRDIEMTYEEVGQGEPAILIHGLGLDHTIWQEAASLFQNQVRFILPDLRGLGKSTLGNADVSLEQMADDIVALMDALGLEKAPIAGHSLGGYVALAIAERHPERLKSLIMVTSRSEGDTETKRVDRLSGATRVEQEGSWMLGESMGPNLSPDAKLNLQLAELVSRTDPAGLANAMRAIASRPDRTPVLAGLDIPVLIISGAQDALISEDSPRAMYAAAKHGSWVHLPGIGHMPMNENPLVLGSVLTAFITRKP